MFFKKGFAYRTLGVHGSSILAHHKPVNCRPAPVTIGYLLLWRRFEEQTTNTPMYTCLTCGKSLQTSEATISRCKYVRYLCTGSMTESNDKIYFWIFTKNKALAKKYYSTPFDISSIWTRSVYMQSMSVTYIFTTNPVMREMVIRKNNLSCIRQSCRNYNGKFSERDFENFSNWHKAIQATFCTILLFPMLVCWVWRIKIFLTGESGLLSPLGKNLIIRILTITRNWLALNWRRCATTMNAWLGKDIIPFHSHQSLGFRVGYKVRGYYDYHHAWLWN